MDASKLLSEPTFSAALEDIRQDPQAVKLPDVITVWRRAQDETVAAASRPHAPTERAVAESSGAYQEESADAITEAKRATAGALKTPAVSRESQ